MGTSPELRNPRFSYVHHIVCEEAVKSLKKLMYKTFLDEVVGEFIR